MEVHGFETSLLLVILLCIRILVINQDYHTVFGFIYYVSAFSAADWLRSATNSSNGISTLPFNRDLNLTMNSSESKLFNIEPTTEYTSDKGFLAFLAVGDSGCYGTHQRAVARAVAHQAEIISADFVILLGDNFYEYGVDSINDPLWKCSFEQAFDLPALRRLPFYAVLGNHDYFKNATAEILKTYEKSVLNWQMPFYFYNQTFKFLSFNDTPFIQPAVNENIYKNPPYMTKIVTDGEMSVAVFVFIDTTLMLREKYMRILKFPSNYSLLLKRQLQFLEKALIAAANRSDWLFLVGHHQIYTDSHRNDNEYLGQILLPYIRKFGVDAYFSGHTHHLEYLWHNEINTSFIISGSSSKLGHSKCIRELCRFAKSSYGFTSHIITKDIMYTAFIDEYGNVLYTTVQPARRRHMSHQHSGGDAPFPERAKLSTEDLHYEEEDLCVTQKVILYGLHLIVLSSAIWIFFISQKSTNSRE